MVVCQFCKEGTKAGSLTKQTGSLRENDAGTCPALLRHRCLLAFRNIWHTRLQYTTVALIALFSFIRHILFTRLRTLQGRQKRFMTFCEKVEALLCQVLGICRRYLGFKRLVNLARVKLGLVRTKRPLQASSEGIVLSKCAYLVAEAQCLK